MKRKVEFTESTKRAYKTAGNNLAILSFAFDSHVGFDVLDSANHFDYTQFGGFTGYSAFF
jgi:hypothetical protein